MNANNIILNEMLKNYFLGTVSKYELGVWSKKAYAEMLQGDFVILEKLCIYAYVKVLSTFHVVPDDIRDEYPCDDSVAKNIHHILNGEEDDLLIIHTQLKPSVFSNKKYKFSSDIELKMQKMSSLKRGLLDSKTAMQKNIVINNFLLQERKFTQVTIFDYLYENLVGILKNIIKEPKDYDSYDSYIGIYLDQEKWSKDYLLLDVFKIISCIIEEKDFKVCIAYLSGAPRISFFIS